MRAHLYILAARSRKADLIAQRKLVKVAMEHYICIILFVSLGQLFKNICFPKLRDMQI